MRYSIKLVIVAVALTGITLSVQAGDTPQVQVKPARPVLIKENEPVKPPQSEVERKRPELRHPAIQLALKDLREAKAALQHAEGDFDGHRAAAVRATELAIRECEEALRSDHSKIGERGSRRAGE